MKRTLKNVGAILGLSAACGMAGCASKKLEERSKLYTEKSTKVANYLTTAQPQHESPFKVPALFTDYGGKRDYRLAVIILGDVDEDGIRDDLLVGIGPTGDPTPFGVIDPEVVIYDNGENGYGSSDSVGYLKNKKWNKVESGEKLKTANKLYQIIIAESSKQIDNGVSKSPSRSISNLIYQLEN